MIEERLKETIALAEKLYGINLSELIVRWDLKGFSAGTASLTKGSKYEVRFNMEVPYEHMVNDTIPHEIAHIVTYMKPGRGCDHDAGWRAVCRDLGGTALRCHNLNLTPARKLRSFLYQDSLGNAAELTTIRHNKLQKGKVSRYTVRDTKATIHSHNFIEEV